ncbi:MAG: cysteine-rich CWC family protein [Propionivibrio sp.]
MAETIGHDDSLPKAVCPVCGRHFVCGMEAGQEECWCMERPVLPLEAGEGGACLCPECFDRLISERTSREA